MRYRFRTLLILLVIGAVVTLVVGITVALREQGEMVRDAYCLDWASVAIVQYLDDNESRYPSDWNDLKPAFAKATAHDQSFSFEEVQSRVIVDFTVDPSTPKSSTAPFLRPRSGRDVRWGSPDPDQRIRDRLNTTMP
jgi:hypothetical protein